MLASVYTVLAPLFSKQLNTSRLTVTLSIVSTSVAFSSFWKNRTSMTSSEENQGNLWAKKTLLKKRSLMLAPNLRARSINCWTVPKKSLIWTSNCSQLHSPNRKQCWMSAFNAGKPWATALPTQMTRIMSKGRRLQSLIEISSWKEWHSVSGREWRECLCENYYLLIRSI